MRTTSPQPSPRWRPGRAAAVLVTVLLVVVACGGSAEPATSPDALAAAAATPSTTASPSPDPMATVDPEGLCRQIDRLELAVARLRGVELRLASRDRLDIAYDDLEMVFGDLADADLGEFRDELEDPLRRLQYRLGELELAVLDFRTNSRPRRAAPHVQRDSETFANDLTAFRVLARC